MRIPSFLRPPEGDSHAIARWLIKFIYEVSQAFTLVDDLDVLYAVPAKVQVGMMRYFGAAIPATAIVSEGLWVYKSTGWVKAV